jgi:TonB family protein
MNSPFAQIISLVIYMARGGVAALALTIPLIAHSVPTSTPTLPPPPNPSATLKDVQDAVELYFQVKPSLRPSAAWLAMNKPPTCSKPRYPRAGLREELEGTTVLNFKYGPDGRATEITLRRSSGWAVLDEAAFEALALCVFQPDSNEIQSVAYRFRLD